MNPKQALNLIDQVSANYQGSRLDHVRLSEAIKVLTQIVERYEVEGGVDEETKKDPGLPE